MALNKDFGNKYNLNFVRINIQDMFVMDKRFSNCYFLKIHFRSDYI